MKLALLDIDGVLLDDKHRSHFYKSHDFTSYFAEENMAQDTGIEEGRELVERLIKEGFVLAYLTGRRGDRFGVTKKSLADAGYPTKIPFIMRPFPEPELKIPLAEYKVDQIQQIVATEQFEEVVLYDDDPRVIKLVQESFGEGYAVHCTWRIKDLEMIKQATV